MKTVFLTLLFQFGILIFGQNCPMKDGIMEIHHFSYFELHNPTEGVTIYSDNKEVNSISDGVVLSILNLPGDSKAVLVKECVIGEEEQYYVYANLESTSLIKGDWVEIGQFIGEANSNIDRFEFEFQHHTKDEKFNPVGILNCKIANIYH